MKKLDLSSLSLTEMGRSIYASAASRLEEALTKGFKTDETLTSASMREKALMLAACQDRPNLVRLLLLAGCDADMQFETGATPLMAAATWNSADVCRLLLDEGADPDHVDQEGMTALDMAVQLSHTAITDMLRAAGAHRAEELPPDG